MFSPFPVLPNTFHIIIGPVFHEGQKHQLVGSGLWMAISVSFTSEHFNERRVYPAMATGPRRRPTPEGACKLCLRGTASVRY